MQQIKRKLYQYIEEHMHQNDLIKLMPIIMLVSYADMLSNSPNIKTDYNYDIIEEYPYLILQTPRDELEKKDSYNIHTIFEIRQAVMEIISDQQKIKQAIDEVSQSQSLKV